MRATALFGMPTQAELTLLGIQVDNTSSTEGSKAVTTTYIIMMTGIRHIYPRTRYIFYSIFIYMYVLPIRGVYNVNVITYIYCVCRCTGIHYYNLHRPS